ncbi:hypothetical protein OKW44_002337 [Paraburkholderia sp. WSM4174]
MSINFNLHEVAEHLRLPALRHCRQLLARYWTNRFPV